MIYNVIIALIIVICILLTIVVLLQSGQGEGLAGGLAAGGGAGSQVMGARRTADLLSKSTTILATAFLTLCVLANFFIERPEVDRSVIQTQGATMDSGLTIPSEDSNTPAPAATEETSEDNN